MNLTSRDFKGTTIPRKKTAEIIDFKNSEKFIGTVLSHKGGSNMSSNEFVTKEQLSNLEEKLDLKIKIAVQPLEGKINNLSTQITNLPTQFENMLLKERQYQDDKSKETQRYIWGTIIIGLAGILASVILHYV